MSKKKRSHEASSDQPDLRSVLRVPAEPDAARSFLSSLGPDAKPRGPKDKASAPAAMQQYAGDLGELQERLYAESKGGSQRRLLLVLQGMDTSGKGGVVEHVLGLVNPAGLALRTFKSPTKEELAHHFLWRIRRAVPMAGEIGIFDRSHYEDVLIAKVRSLVDAETIEKRYAEINRFEQGLVDDGVTIIKCFLNISYDEQRERLLARLDDPTKHWKFNEGDIEERQRWDDYQAAYFEALTRCNTDAAPWYAIPSDRKWYRNWAIGQILLETLMELDPQYPKMDLDVPALKARLAPPN
ncbi:polyphosphate kinase 2 family protein [Epidermidibacterium keratini]|uniref:Polyphosphate kinase 2 family protein n=1 Tax=Epidermidibacterium keratini TaxID=1891644 RepID=A0A7L4YU42_9ACTN|nr:PPK2 family polyphosphate kinase [Epidermidibacterium keratini]QHC01987.1 polyphosphate kinase 2 family protein [Epidermidibacterium keratini]